MADKYGVTDKGFVRKRLPEIQSDVFDKLDKEFKAPVSRNPYGVFGVIIGIISAEIDRQWQECEKTYNAMYPSSSNGVQLDNAMSFTGVKRPGASFTTIYPVCYGSQNTLLTRYAMIEGEDRARFELTALSTITSGNCVNVTLTVPQVAANMVYSMNIDGITYIYTAAGNDTMLSVMNGLMEKVPEGWTAEILTDTLEIRKTDRQYGSTFAVSSTLSIIRVGSPLKFQAVSYGAENPPLYSVNKIITQIPGWESVSNESENYIGSDAETDTEARQLYSRRVFALGMTMVDTIRAALLELEGVTSARVYQNKKDIADETGRLPHCVEAIVQGGDPLKIAQTVLIKTGAGIDTFGSETVTVLDSQGTPQDISFNRPEIIDIWARITITPNPEEELAGDAAQQIINIMLDTATNEILVGTDVRWQIFYGPIYKNVPGVGVIKMELSTDGISFEEKNIIIGVRQLACFDVSRISVVIDT